MEITFIGATRTVTGSMHLFEYKRQKFLIECGLYQGHRAESERINRTFPFKPREVRCVILSHAHLDHSGNLPTLVKKNFKGDIYCTPATGDIAELLLLDSAHLHEHDIAYFNKKQKKAGLPTKEPLYTVSDAEEAIRYFRSINYHNQFEPVEDVFVTFYDAGHILGSAQILIEFDGKRVLFSGDLGRKNMPIIKDPEIIRDIDYLILESTYGNRIHSSVEQMTDELKSIVIEGREKKSKIIIPAFAVERTQVLITMLKQLYEDGVLNDIPIYVDSPLATSVTEVFVRHPECFDKETYSRFIKEEPFDFPGITYIKDQERSKELNHKSGPMIIISASGMCEGGRVLHHLIHSIESENNIIILTGFQASGTLGRKLLDGYKEVFIFDTKFTVRAKVYFMAGLSAHADSNDLVEFVDSIKNSRLKKVYLIHGEITEAVALKDKIQALGIPVEIPECMARVEL
ncbi:MAG: MBL fold metallo-hydrolase [candidate division WOR-3 bacterium]|nr:MBL fold metallo-hydrolase [candidate division WOR-3 bacterium]